MKAKISAKVIGIILLGFIGFLIFGFGISVKPVITGECLICKHCGKILREDIDTLRIPLFESKEKYFIKERKDTLCDKCANEIVAIKTGTIWRCKKCGKVYKRRIRKIRVKRKNEDKHEVKEIGKKLCLKCRQAEKKKLLVGVWKATLFGGHAIRYLSFDRNGNFLFKHYKADGTPMPPVEYGKYKVINENKLYMDFQGVLGKAARMYGKSSISYYKFNVTEYELRFSKDHYVRVK